MSSFCFAMAVFCASVFTNYLVVAKPGSSEKMPLDETTEALKQQRNTSGGPISQDAKVFAAEVKQFISKLSKEERHELESIFQDTSLNKSELSNKFHFFASTLTQTLKEQAEDLYAKVESFRQKLLANFSSVELTPSAAAALEKMKDIAEDNSLTLPAECEKAQAVIQGLDEADRQSLHIPAQKNVDCTKIGQMLFAHH